VLIALIVVAAAGGLILLALAVVLLLQLRRVSMTVAALNREIAPIRQELRRDSERARDRLQELAERYGRPEGDGPPSSSGPGARR
jgi:cobalamin biosynthesis protein CobD/CbiB